MRERAAETDLLMVEGVDSALTPTATKCWQAERWTPPRWTPLASHVDSGIREASTPTAGHVFDFKWLYGGSGGFWIPGGFPKKRPCR